jgi:dipeptidase E
MQTTNDMPIVYPPNFKTLGILPFDLNAHFLDADLQSKHMGETRDIRIKSFMLTTLPVLGLREGSWLKVDGDQIIVKGEFSARLFKQNQIAEELETGTDISYVK